MWKDYKILGGLNMDRYEAHIKKHYGEYIYAQICSKIAVALNKMHQEEGCKPDFIIEKGIEFTTKSQFCLEKYDKALWDEIYAIASREYRQLAEDDQDACRVYIDVDEGEFITDEEIIIDICCEFETILGQWVIEYVEEEMLEQRMSKQEAKQILLSYARGDLPLPFMDDDDWDDEEEEETRPYSGNINIVKRKFHS